MATKRIPFQAQPRKVIGHNVKAVRAAGAIPGTIYGKAFESKTIELDREAFGNVYLEAGETNLLDLKIDGEIYPVLIHQVQIHPVTREVLNVEFLKVNLTEKLKTSVAVAIIGESRAVADGLGTLLTVLNEIDIEALPSNIPDSIEVSVAGLNAVNDEVKIKDISAPEGVVILSEPDITIVKVGALVKEEAAPAPAPAAATTEGQEPVTPEGAPPSASESKETPKEEPKK